MTGLLGPRKPARAARQFVEFATAAAGRKHKVPGDWMRGNWGDIEVPARVAVGMRLLAEGVLPTELT